jgi:outer membrane protein TolC
MHNLYRAGAIALAMLWTSGLFAGEAPLGLSEAVKIAVTAEDPALLRFDARAEALEDRAVADSQLPDPTIRGALANLSTDTFRFEQENMTQAQVGLRQAFPAGRTLSLMGERRRGEADIERARKDLAIREIELAVRTAWFDQYYWLQAQASIQESQTAVTELMHSLRASYSTGALTTQHVLRAELELSLLDDQLTDLQRREAITRADLARYIDAAAVRPLSGNMPDLADPPTVVDMQTALVHHPAVLLADAIVDVGGTDIALAEQAYEPSWALEAGYGARGGGRSDLATIGVTLSIPLFVGSRQDRRVSAATLNLGAARLDRAARLLDLRRDLERANADWLLLGERVELYGAAVIGRARETASASISTYANGRTDFPEMIRSQLAQLEVELKRVKLLTERGKAWARLDYLVGDIQ